METTSLPKTFAVSKEYVAEWKGELFCLIKDYFVQSEDKNSTPGKVLLDLVENTGQENYLLIVHEEENVPVGFLVGKIINETARILLAFLGKGLESAEIIQEAIRLFDEWAVAHHCTAGDLYTHRHPKSYRAIAKLGWTHRYTVYRKDYL